MTDIITRYFEDPADARAVRFELIHRRRFPLKIVGLYESADGLAEALTKADVHPETAKEYQKRVKKSGSVLLVRAGYKPLSVGRTTREVLAEMGATAIEGLNEENFVPEKKGRKLSVLQDHRHMLFRPRDPLYDNVHMADWPIGLISRRKPTTVSVIKPHGRFASWPIGLLAPSKIRYGRFPFDFLIPGHKHQADKPIGLLLPHDKRYGAFPFGFLVPHAKRYGAFPFGLLIPGNKFQAKFPFGHLVPKGMRMANWPFPLLINGKQGQNSLVPGQKYMAKFPFAHIVPGHKYMADKPIGHKVSHNRRYGRFPIGLLVPGQKFMAKFPFGHIVPGHKHYAKFPFDHIVPGHKYMANWIWPHTKTKTG
ncbi:PucR family transcriptional regulator [Tropicimonas sp. S265A]|uniref:PucR family transcriptional regulator n=1 Tax=Tropicimonas sp. S265A TaxID=3415134 RepID=UPI003C7C73C7